MTSSRAAPPHFGLPPLQPVSKIAALPAGGFAVIMGLLGLSLAVRAAEQVHPAFGQIGDALGGAVTALFLALLYAFALKWLRYREAAREEWRHPIKSAFFPAISISVLLIAIVLAPHAQGVASGVWLIGAALQAALSIAIIARWIGPERFEIAQVTPIWFIPAVGNIVAPIAGAQLGFIELSWLFFAAGLVFWIVLLALVMNRLILADPMPQKLKPSLAILIAPPAVGFIAWVALTGEIDPFATILLNAAYVFAALVATQASRILRGPFVLARWALSFPTAALCIASFVYGERQGSVAHEIVGIALLVLLMAIVTDLIRKTAKAFRSGALFQPE